VSQRYANHATPAHGPLAFDAASMPRWRSHIIRLGRTKAVLLVTAASILLSLLVTILVMRGVDPEGEYLVAALCIAIAVPAMVAPVIGHVTISLVLDLDRAHHELKTFAARDPLTGIFNRAHFMERLEAEAGRHFRTSDPMTLVMLDADHFKAINDTYGHATGDRVLVSIAQTCAGVLRADDVLARYGGEEFVALLPSTSRSEALDIAERIRTAVAAMTVAAPSGEAIAVTVSIGLSTLASPDPGCRRLFDSADSALYDAKRAGRNRCVVAERGAE
jgi:diguanylate cyclase (GGDEF)-like protein